MFVNRNIWLRFGIFGRLGWPGLALAGRLPKWPPNERVAVEIKTFGILFDFDFDY